LILLNILLAAVLFYVILKWDVKSDLKKLNEGKLVKHGVEWVFRALLLSPTVLLLSLPFYLDSTLEIILKLSISAALTAFTFWELFDGLYNKGRNMPWRYNGSDEAHDASTDKFLKKYTAKQQAFIKLGLISISLIAYLIVKF